MNTVTRIEQHDKSLIGTVQDACTVMALAYQRGWITTRDGNVSLKLFGELWVSPSGARKYQLKPEDFVRADAPFEEGRPPSGELLMHQAIHKVAGPAVAVVLHLHPTHIVAATLADPDIINHGAKQLTELSMSATLVGPTVPQIRPYTEAFAEATAKALYGSNIVAQCAHGATAWATNPWEAFEHIERLNHICEILLLARK